MNPAQLLDLNFFYGLSVSELNLISPYFSCQTFSSGQMVFEQGALAEYLYLVCEGSIEIIFKPDDGPPMRITSISSGGIFGWSAATGNIAYTSGALCSEDSKILKIRGRDLHAISKKNTELGALLLDRLTAVISDRWQDRQYKINELLRQSAFRQKERKVKIKGDNNHGK